VRIALIAIAVVSTVGLEFETHLHFEDSTSKFINFSNMSASHWISKLDKLPKERIPSFFFAHGSPLLLYPKDQPNKFFDLSPIGGPDGPNAAFLKDFGKFLLDRYKPKGIVVFSAHWETDGEIEVMSYNDNHLFYDYYGFPKSMYEIKFESKGSPTIAKRVVELFKQKNIKAKTIEKGRGLDHGVFVPFKLMFPDGLTNIPVVEVSIDSSLDPQRHIDIGKAMTPLRDEGILVLSGGLTIHTFQETDAWDPKKAPKGFLDFERSIVSSVENNKDGEARNSAMKDIVKHPYFRRAHPRTEHFIPIYVGAGAGSDGDASVISDLHGAISIAFGI